VKNRTIVIFGKKLATRATHTVGAKRNLKIILDDFQHANHKNYDHTNDLHAEDILFYLGKLVAKLCRSSINDFLDLVNLQLDEMSSGICPQGRTHRFYQVALAFI
jgi:hypothetical protein